MQKGYLAHDEKIFLAQNGETVVNCVDEKSVLPKHDLKCFKAHESP